MTWDLTTVTLAVSGVIAASVIVALLVLTREDASWTGTDWTRYDGATDDRQRRVRAYQGR